MALELENRLSEAGFVVVGVAGTAEEALEIANSERPLVAIMDVRLGGARDGVDAAIELQEKLGIRSGAPKPDAAIPYSGVPPVPKHLSERAQCEWERLAPAAVALGTFRTTDGTCVRVIMRSSRPRGRGARGH